LWDFSIGKGVVPRKFELRDFSTKDLGVGGLSARLRFRRSIAEDTAFLMPAEAPSIDGLPQHAAFGFAF